MGVLTHQDFIAGFRKLNIDRTYPVIVHASLSAFGQVQGGADSIMSALLSSFDTLIMPVFTYKTMVIPETGPPDNGITYGSGKETNQLAEMFQPDMPADKKMGALAEALRQHPRAHRSLHPILSFAGVNARMILETQMLHDPLLPIQGLIDEEGWVLLMGVNHTVNTSIHYAEKLAGRKQFIRWAMTPDGIISTWGFPGCSEGFDAIAPRLARLTSSVELGDTHITAVPVLSVMDAVCGMLKKDPLALLCERPDCGRCRTIRNSVAGQPASQPE